MAHQKPATPPKKNAIKKFHVKGTGLVFLGLALGIVAGGVFPEHQFPFLFQLFQLFSNGFIGLIKGIIVPLLFSTIIVGIAQTGDVKAVGRLGAKALLYFEVVTTLALAIGLVVGNVIRPGVGMPIQNSVSMNLPKPPSGWDVVLNALPTNLVQHAATGSILPVVIFAAIFAIGLIQIGEKGKPVLTFFESVAQAMFKYTDLIMKLTPIGVFGAMAHNVSHMAAGHMVDGQLLKGWPAVFHLLKRYALLVGSLYGAMLVLVVAVFVPIMFLAGIRIRRFFQAIRSPAVTAFSTASSEAALPRLLEEMEIYGVPRRVASFVIPAGYSFNLDGSTLYLVLASLTIAQAAGIDLPLSTQIFMMLTFMLTSKGVAGVPRTTLVIIAGTCHSFGLPGEAGVAMILAIDGIMDMARSAINVIGNGLAAAVIARWEESRDRTAARSA